MSVILFGRQRKPSPRAVVSNADDLRKTGAKHANSAQDLLLRLDWQVLRRLDGVLHGDYRSLMRGFGLDLADLREYQAEDDVRFIDWNVTARMNTPYVRQFQEDRDVCAWFLMDLSASMRFGHPAKKSDQALNFAGTMARILTRHGNPVASLIYTQTRQADIDLVTPPQRGRLQVLQMLEQAQLCCEHSASPETDKGKTLDTGLTNLERLIEAGRQRIRRRSMVFVLSDFISDSAWAKALSLLAQRHEVVAVRISDPLERRLPDMGGLYVQDAETGEQLWLDTSDAQLRKRFEDASQQRDASLAERFARAGVDVLELSTDRDLALSLIEFAQQRRMRKRRA
jgi:uncharacterized protein (DUF58 family)